MLGFALEGPPASHRLARIALALAVLTAGCGSADAPLDIGSADQRLGCVSDAQCTDNRYCNGDERCEPESDFANAFGCVGGAPPCAAALCEEADRSCAPACPDADGDGASDAACGGSDCDDADANRFPGNLEVCDVDDHDEDCDVQTFGNRDLDGDRFFDDACCNQVGSTRVCGLDCDDGSMGVNPVVPEVCNGYDDNCDGSVDAFCGCTQPGLVRACSMDGPGTCRAGTESCAGGSWSACTGVLGATEDYLCDGQDEDCDGNIDEGLTIECVLDVDHDGHRSASMPARETECPDPARMGAPTFGCPAGYTLFVASASADCCDTDSRTYPRAPAAEDWHAEQDACGSWDYNCDGTDEGRITNVSRNPACASGLGGCHCTSGCGRGWQSGTAPACGATARVCDGCVDSGNSCGSNCTDDVLQTCR